MPHRVPRPPRGESREIAELKRLKADSPDLGGAVDLQVGLLEVQRRIQARVPLPPVSAERMRQRQRDGEGPAILHFGDIPLDWSDFRLLFRETAELLRRHDALDEGDYRQALVLTREGNALEPVVQRWYEKTASHPGAHGPSGSTESLDQIILLAMRPFLARCAEAVMPHLDLSSWGHPHCPLCGGEPEFATITPAAERFLICTRCSGQWPFHPLACPFCGNDDRRAITSFATRDGRYRIYACDVCHRYLKAYDGRAATRPVMLAVDTIATLPLDAAAMQRGYRAE